MANSAFPHSFRLRRLSLLLALAWGGVPSLHAQQVPGDAKPDGAGVQLVASGGLKEVVISGSRSERALEDVPATMDVLSGDALNPASVQDIRDLVRELPNVSVSRQPTRFSATGTPVGREGNAGFNIRGLEGNRVLLLVDGIRVPQGLTNGVLGGAAFGRDYYDLGLISRVEIVRGANSALYGSDGLAGSVSMFTTEPHELIKPGQTLGGKVVTGYSSEDGGKRLGLTLAGVASDTVQWLGSVQVGRSSELINKGANESLNLNRTVPNPQSDSQQAFLGKVVITPGVGQKHTLTLEHVTKDSEVEAYTGRAVTASAATSVIDLDATSEAGRSRLSWDARYKLGRAWADGVRTTLGVQSSETREVAREDRFTSADRVRDTSYNERMTQATIQAEKTLAMGGDWSQKLIYGADVSRANMTNLVTGVTPPTGETFPLKRFPDTLTTTSALFVQSEMANEAWSVIPALRYDRVSIDASSDALYKNTAASLGASALSPKLGGIYRVSPQWSVFSNLAGGFKAPTPIQLNNFFENNAGGFYKSISNPDLKPETSVTFELGTRGQWGPLDLEAAAFSGRYKDFIEETVLVSGQFGNSANPAVLQSVNRSAVSLRGFEIKGAYKLAANTALRLAYGQTQGTVTSTGLPLNSVNPAKFVLGLDQRLGAWKVGAVLSHVAAKSASDIDYTTTAAQFATPAYTTLDLKASWQLRPGISLNAALNNVTDTKYWEWTNVRGVAAGAAALDSYTAPGRSASIALVASF